MKRADGLQEAKFKLHIGEQDVQNTTPSFASTVKASWQVACLHASRSSRRP